MDASNITSILNSFDLSSKDLTVPLLVAIITFCLLLVHLVIRISCGRSSPDIVMFYDESNALNYRYQYIVRLLYGPKSFSFDDSNTTLFGEVEHSINRIVKIPFSPATMSRVFLYKGHRTAKVFIRSGERYSNISKLLMYHNGRGSIIIVALELQEIDEENAIASVLNSPIFSANSGRAAKVTAYPFGREHLTPLEDDIRPTRNVTAAEAVYLLYASANAVYLVAIFLLEKKCDEATFCDYDKGLLFGAASGAAGYLLFFLTALFCRLVIRRLYYRNLGRGCSKVLRLMYLGLVIAGGIALGAYASHLSITGAYSTGKINERAQLLSAAVIWGLITGVGLFTLLVLIGLSLPLAVYFRFIVLLDDDSTRGSRSSGAGLLRRLAGGGGRRDTRSTEDSFSIKSDTTREHKKFKSEEAFSTAQSFAEMSTYEGKDGDRVVVKEKGRNAPRRGPPPPPPEARPVADKEKQNRKQRKPQRHEQDDNAYAHILANKQKVVRSISQYESDDGTEVKTPLVPPKAPPPKNRRPKNDTVPKSVTIEGTGSGKKNNRNLKVK